MERWIILLSLVLCVSCTTLDIAETRSTIDSITHVLSTVCMLATFGPGPFILMAVAAHYSQDTETAPVEQDIENFKVRRMSV